MGLFSLLHFKRLWDPKVLYKLTCNPIDIAVHKIIQTCNCGAPAHQCSNAYLQGYWRVGRGNDSFSPLAFCEQLHITAQRHASSSLQLMILTPDSPSLGISQMLVFALPGQCFRTQLHWPLVHWLLTKNKLGSSAPLSFTSQGLSDSFPCNLHQSCYL